MKKLLMLLLAAALLLSSLAAGADPAAADAPLLLGSARWIWSGDRENNVWVCFVRSFDLERVPEEAPAEIAAENKYFLWVNGQEVVFDGGMKRGPNPADGYFDTVNLAPYLTEGTNTLCVLAWFWGVKGEDQQSYSNVPVDTAGLIFAADVGGQRIVTDGSWKAHRHAAFLDDTALGVAQANYRFPEYNVYYAAAEDDCAGWTEPGFDAAFWAAAEVRGSYGDAPWNALHRRPIPLLRVSEQRDYRNSRDFADTCAGEDRQLEMLLPCNAQVHPGLTVSAGQEAVITITTDNTAAAQSLTTTYVTSSAGEQTFVSPSWVSGMRVIYHIPAGVTVKRLFYRESGYDTEIAGVFAMGDPFFDALWEMGARTQYVCIRETFMDCPDRERAQWTGDAASQMRQMVYCLDPSAYALFPAMLSQKVAWITPGSGKGKLDNLIPTVTPISGEFYELPAQEMACIVSVWDYYLYTGDAEALEIIYEPAIRYLKRWKLGPSGLVKHKTGQGLVDWQDTGAQVDTKVSENAWYYWCLVTLEKIAGVLGVEEPWLRETADTIAAGYESLWVEGVGYTTTASPDDRGNALAVLSGLAPASRYAVILGVLQSTFKASSYMEVYVLRALCEMGYVSEALERMQARYGNMVSVNQEKGISTLWEYFEEGMGTWNHAWSAGGVYLLPAWVGGVRPTAPGWETCVITPDFSHSDTVSVTVSTVKGLIAVEGTAASLSVTLPEGVTAQVRLPGAEAQTVSGAGAHLVTP